MRHALPVLSVVLVWTLGGCAHFRAVDPTPPPATLEAVNQLLRNRPVRVDLVGGRVYGRVKAFDRISVDSTYWIDYSDRRVGVPTAEVSRITPRAELTATSGFFLGMMGGLGVGAGGYAYWSKVCKGWDCLGAALFVPFSALAGGVVGLIVGVDARLPSTASGPRTSAPSSATWRNDVWTSGTFGHY